LLSLQTQMPRHAKGNASQDHSQLAAVQARANRLAALC